MNFINLVGLRFGRLIVIEKSNRRNKMIRYLVYCDCGRRKKILGSSLRRGNTKSCGCLREETVYRRGVGEKLLERRMLSRARVRAKRDGLPMTLVLSDIKIPEFCPILGCRIEKSTNNRERSPSLDRHVNASGYTPENTAVISYRANRIKNDATLEELKALVKYMEEFKNGRL